MIELSKKFVALKLNPEDEAHPENQELQQKYKVSGYPAVVFASADGDLISNNSGYRPPVPFLQLMRQTLTEEEAFQKLIQHHQKDPQDLQTTTDLALIYIKRENLTRGQPLIDQIIEQDANNAGGYLLPIYLELGLMYLSQSKVELAESKLEQILALKLVNLDLSDLYLNLGLYYGQRADGQPDPKIFFKKAISNFETVVQKYPQSQIYEDAQLYLGITYMLQEEKQLAIGILEKLSQTAKNDDIRDRAKTVLGNLRVLPDKGVDTGKEEQVNSD